MGSAVKISADGTTIDIGAQYNGDNGTDCGQIQVYKFNQTLSRYLKVGSDILGEAAGDRFGSSVGIVSANGTTGLDIDGEAASDQFGSSADISADGSKVVIGAPFNDDNGTSSGHVRVFNFDQPIKTFAQVGIALIGREAGDHAGQRVSISADGTTVVAGAPFVEISGVFRAGYIRVYNFNATINRYTQFGSDIVGGERVAGSNLLGSAIGLSAFASTIVVGAPTDIDPNNGRKFFSNIRIFRKLRLRLPLPRHQPGSRPSSRRILSLFKHRSMHL